MKTRLLFLSVIFLLLGGSTLSAQTVMRQSTMRGIANTPVRLTQERESGNSATYGVWSNSEQNLPASIVLAGTSSLGIQGKFDRQTNQRALHNVQVDPSNPNNIHAVVMMASANTTADTIGYAFPSRRCYYTFSNDGGTTWKTPIPLGNIRAGYPDMQLYLRGSNYVPVIAAHRADPSVASEYVSAIWVEKGNPGDGNFGEIDCDRTASDGVSKDIIWPNIAIKSTGSTATVYMVANVSPAPGSPVNTFDYFEFGSFSLNADGTGTWNGWKSQPGGAQQDLRGYASNGATRIRISENGNLGVLWQNPDADLGDHSLYFTQSKDGGTTWDTIAPIFQTLLDASLTRGIGPNFGMDFFYQNNIPHFTYEIDEQNMNESDSNGYYFPYSSQLFYWSPGNPLMAINMSPAAGLIALRQNPLGEVDTALYATPATNYFTNVPQVTGLFPSPAYIGYPTFARTTDTNVFAIFYQTIQDDDTATLTDKDGNPVTEWYSAIYYQRTNDGGHTWTDPIPYHANATGSPDKLDYRFPEASDYNVYTGGHAAGVANYHTIFQVDSLPGSFDAQGSPTWDMNEWKHQVATVNAVKSATPISFTLSQNYPNPFNPSTTISFDLVRAGNAQLTVTDVLGRTVATLVNGMTSAGAHQVKFDASALPSGVYSYTLKVNGSSFTERMVLTK